MDLQIRELEQRAATDDGEALVELAAMLRRIDAPMTIEIDGETVTVISVYPYGDDRAEVEVETEDGEEMTYQLFRSEEEAGIAARAYWQDMAENDPRELGSILGDECLIAWGLGQPYAPGSHSVSSLSEWLDLWTNNPEEQWASYDGESCDVRGASAHLRELIGFNPEVAYRAD